VAIDQAIVGHQVGLHPELPHLGDERLGVLGRLPAREEDVEGVAVHPEIVLERVEDVARVGHALLLAERAEQRVEEAGRVDGVEHPREAAEGGDGLVDGADLGDAAEDDHGGARGDGVRADAAGGREEVPHVREPAGPAEHVERGVDGVGRRRDAAAVGGEGEERERAERVPVREAEAAHDGVEERGRERYGGRRERGLHRGRRGRGRDDPVHLAGVGVGVRRGAIVAGGWGGGCGGGRRLARLVGDVLEEPGRGFGRHFARPRGGRRFAGFWRRRRGGGAAAACRRQGN